eukprot:Em0001g638a
MATSSPEDTYSRFRLHLQGSFSSQEEKETFLRRFEAAKQLLAPGCKRNATISVLNTLLDRVLTQPENVQASNSRTSYSRNEMMLDSAGIYTGDEDASDQDLFVVERKTFKSLCSGLVQQCGCLSNPSWTIASFIKKGHVARVQFVCPHCKQSRVWASSRVLSGHYLANQKLVHAFTCAGMLPRQYMNFALFAGMGVVKHKYISSVYLNQLYQQVVTDVAEESMKAAVERVKESPHHAKSGEWVITDARHDSTSNAYHSTVPCLAGSTHRIVGISTLSRQQHRVAQTREVACTKIVLPQVIARGLNITEVAHDYQATIKLYVRQLGMVNSYDTWHGTKNVAKQLRHICAGTVRTRDRTWFTELSDKARCTKVHLYWCMRNCGGNPVRLRAMIMNISKHFQGDHQSCSSESPCQQPGYVPKRKPLTMPAAISAYEAALRKTLIYKNADSCHLCRDTYWVESFNHQLLTYLPKRIHFHTKTFEMRMNLAVMDWNENCQRMATSHHKYTDVRRPDHHSTYNVLVKKTYRFVNNIWSMYVLRNITSQQILQDDEDDDEMVLPDDAAMYDGDYVDSEDDDYVCSEDDLEPWLQLALDGLV